MAQHATSPIADEVIPLLGTRHFGRNFRAFAILASTNTMALEWAAAGAEEGSVVFADYQTAGRGRRGRTWLSAAGQNLLFSIVLRPRVDSTRWNLITLAASVAVANAVDALATPLRTAIKWPNDILLEGAKCCGMLLKSSLLGRQGGTVILGIGLNVNQRSFPEALEERATSLLLQTGQQISRMALLADILTRLEKQYDLLHYDEEAVLMAYTARLHGLGQDTLIQTTLDATPLTGTILGITPTGALRLHTEDGERVCHVGDTEDASPGLPQHAL